MLKPMNPKPAVPRNLILWVLVGVLMIAGIVALVSAFSGGGTNPEDEVNAVYTNAAATLAAQQLTLQASTPTVTPTVFTQTPTVTVTALASPTLFLPQSVASNTPAAVSGAVGCNNSEFVTDVTFPDNTAVTPGQAIVKTWRLQNTGSCPWTTAYKVSFLGGNAMGGATTPLAVTVQPGQSADITVNMTAPAAAGNAQGTWILTNDSGQNFGTSFYILVTVGGTTTTGTPVTITPGGPTATATATGVAIAKPSPANNPTITLACTPDGAKYKFSGTLTWEDTSNNESGFRIYINGTLITSTSSNVTSFNVTESTFPSVDAATPINFSVEAFTGGGGANPAVVTRQCP